MHPWDPHKAAKDIEVGDFYFRRRNYRAALDRYREALVYKPDDAIANFRLGESFEKLDQPDEAMTRITRRISRSCRTAPCRRTRKRRSGG